MPGKYVKSKVYENLNIKGNVYRLTIEGEFHIKPGQFFMLRAWGKDPFLSRPISVHNVENGRISFLYEVKGKGTNLLKALKSGNYINILGPLGNGFDLNNISGNVAIVSGGIGIAPMLYNIRKLNGIVDLYLGFKDEPYMVDEMSEFANRAYISTDSGKEGYKGVITDIFTPENYDYVLCCGPKIMMKKVVDMCKAKSVPCYVSLESYMACGVGACLGCAVKTTSGMKRVCKDGPVFLGKEVVFDD